MVVNPAYPTSSSSQPIVVSTFFELMKGLPQELIDEIINHLDPNDSWLLKNCSLVARSWTPASQKRLFETFEVLSWKLEECRKDISPENMLVQHVRRLRYHDYGGRFPPTHTSALRDYFRSFRRLERLFFYGTSIRCFPEEPIELFSTFKNSLSNITLWNCDVTEDALATVIDHFPKLTTLDFRWLRCLDEGKPSQILSLPLVKAIYIQDWTGEYESIIRTLSKLGLCFVQIAFLEEMTSNSFLKCFVDAFGARAETLKLPDSVRSMCSLLCPIIGVSTHNPRTDNEPWELSRCDQLRKLEINRCELGFSNLDTISSVTSTKIEKIVVTSSITFSYPASHDFWTRLDHILVKLVELSEFTEPRLEVEFRDSRDIGLENDFGKKTHLPRFVKKRGRMTILDRQNCLIYCSDDLRKADSPHRTDSTRQP